MQSPDSECSRPSVSARCLSLILAVFEPGAETVTFVVFDILTRLVVRILLVYCFLQQTQYLTHHQHKQSLLRTGLFICTGLNQRLVEMSIELCSHIFTHLVRIIIQNFSNFDGVGVVFPLCVL